MENKIFSPSAIKTFAECPMLYELQYVDRYELRQANRPWHGKTAGDAFSVGVAAVHSYLKAGLPVNVETVVKQTLGQHTLNINNFLDAGGIVERADVDNVQRDLERAIRRYCVDHPFTNWRITEVEKCLGPEYGNARPDLIGYDQHAILSVADIKFKRNLATDYRNSTIEEYRYDWQFLHYAWAMQEYYQQPVNVYLALVVLNPSWHCQLYEFVYDETIIRMTKQSVERWSEQMSQQLAAGPPLGASHSTKYGPCPFIDMCFKYKFDPELAKEKYIQIKRKVVDAN